MLAWCVQHIVPNMATNANPTPATTTPAAPAKAKGSVQAPPAPTAALPPGNVFAAPMGRSTATHVCQVGTVYSIAVVQVAAPGAAPLPPLLLPFALPAGASNGAVVTLASTNPNWLGRNGAPLTAYVFAAPGMPGCGVVLQPHAGGYKANAYTTGLHVCALPAAPVAPVAKA